MHNLAVPARCHREAQLRGLVGTGVVAFSVGVLQGTTGADARRSDQKLQIEDLEADAKEAQEKLASADAEVAEMVDMRERLAGAEKNAVASTNRIVQLERNLSATTQKLGTAEKQLIQSDGKLEAPKRSPTPPCFTTCEQLDLRGSSENQKETTATRAHHRWGLS